MPPDFITGSLIREVAWGVGIVLVSALLAWLIFLVMRIIEKRLKKPGRRALPSQLLQSLHKPLIFLIISQGIILALNSIFYQATWRSVLATVSVTLIIIFATYGIARICMTLLGWYMHRARARQSLISLTQRSVLLLVFVIGLLIVLEYNDISISPLIAGLGLGGLAIALALQPTLSNFFAGAQIVSDRLVKVGDYIELEDGSTRGYITDIGWRSTRMRTPFNNMLIIPNSRLVDSIITNYYGPTMEVAVIVNCGISYSSDLFYVERVALEVAHEVVDELDEAVKTFEPWFGFEEFGDSNINFWLWLQAKDRISTFRMKSELIKRLKARLDKEGITINYPVRTTYLHWPEGTQPLSLDSTGSNSMNE